MSASPEESGAITLDGEVVYLVAMNERGQAVSMGEFPHAEMFRDKRAQCRATIKVTDAHGTSEERCTRSLLHDLPHVKHLRRGMPVIAWRPESEGRES